MSANELCDAACSGDLEKAKRLIEGKADIHSTGLNGKQPLHNAVSNFQIEMCKFLIANGATIDDLDNEGRTPLDLAYAYQLKAKILDYTREELCDAARGSDSKEVKRLIEIKAEIHLKNSEGKTPLDLAASPEVKAVMIDEEKKNQEVLNTALCDAARDGALRKAKRLIERKADVHWKDSLPLQNAANSGHTAICKLLVTNGANISVLFEDGLHSAADRDYLELCKFLIANGASIESLDPDGKTPVELASTPELKAAMMDTSKKRKEEEKRNKAKKPLQDMKLLKPLLEKCVKVLVVGEANVGKTALVQRLLYGKWDAGCVSTQGVERYLLQASECALLLTDFAGQPSYFQTHQFFLSEEAIYMLVWNKRRSKQPELQNWLKLILYHAPKASVLLVETAIDEDIKMTSVKPDELRREYGDKLNLQIMRVSTLMGSGISKLLAELETAAKPIISRMEKPQDDLEKVLQTIETYRTRELTPLMSFQGFQQLIKECFEKDIPELREAPKLREHSEKIARFLHQSGVILFYLHHFNLVVLSPEWLATALTQAMELGSQCRGIVTKAKLKACWFGQPFDTLLALFEYLDICFVVKDQIMIPCQLITAKHPLNGKIACRYIYSLEYIPSGFFSRLMARLAPELLREDAPSGSLRFSQHGLLLEDSKDSSLMVLFDEKQKTVSAHVTPGPSQQVFIFKFKDEMDKLIQLHHIHPIQRMVGMCKDSKFSIDELLVKPPDSVLSCGSCGARAPREDLLLYDDSKLLEGRIKVAVKEVEAAESKVLSHNPSAARALSLKRSETLLMFHALWRRLDGVYAGLAGLMDSIGEKKTPGLMYIVPDNECSIINQFKLFLTRKTAYRLVLCCEYPGEAHPAVRPKDGYPIQTHPNGSKLAKYAVYLWKIAELLQALPKVNEFIPEGLTELLQNVATDPAESYPELKKRLTDAEWENLECQSRRELAAFIQEVDPNSFYQKLSPIQYHHENEKIEVIWVCEEHKQKYAKHPV